MRNAYCFRKILWIVPLLLIHVSMHAQQLASAEYLSPTKESVQDARKSLSEVIQNLETQFKVRFNFNTDLVTGKFVDSASFDKFPNNQNLDEILEKLLQPLNLKYERLNQGHYVIYENMDKSESKKQVSPLQQRGIMWNANASLQQNYLNRHNPAHTFSVSRFNKLVTGQITDENDETLPGVNIVEKGTTNGTITDIDGKYSLNVSDGATLVFSSVGYMSQEIEVGNQSTINVSMTPDIQQLEELIVVGYGTQKKSDLTGAVARADIEAFSQQPNVNILQSLQGSVPGLNVGAVTRAGETPDISIRGQNTLSSSSADNQPLIVVDGIIYRGNMADLNPNDIASVDILKDASSAAIYGSQAANGVVIITTKQGSGVGKPIISYSGQYSIQAPSNNLEPMRGDEYEDFLMDVFWTQSRLGPDYLTPNPDFSLGSIFKTQGITQGYLNGADNDWWGMLTGNGHIQSHDVSIRGQNESISYFVSGGYTDQQGFLKNDEYERFNVRLNLSTDITDWLTIGVESFLSSSDYSGVSPSVGEAFHLQPYAPIYDENGDYVLEPEAGLNPFLQMQIDDSDKRMNFFGNFHADIKLPFLEGFNYRINYSHNYRTTNQDQFNPWGANYTGLGSKDAYIFYDWTFDNIFSYQKDFNEDHRLNATLLYGVEHRDYKFTETSAQRFTNMVLGYNKLEAGDPTLFSLNTGAEEEASLYTMGRLFYSYKDKYMITGTVRRDGFSGFGTKQKIGVFPSLALGWVASEESFFNNAFGWLDYFKLRASYGTTARRSVGRYQTLAQVSIAPSRVFGDGGSTTIGQWISSMANNELGWETTTGLNLGVDFEILDSRVYGNIEYYNNNTSDILYNIQIPSVTGFSNIATNIGEVHNHGIELSLTGQLVQAGNFSWEATFNFASNRNRIESILGVDNDGDGKEDDIISNDLFIGEPQNLIYEYNITGMWQLADEEAEIIPDGFFPGTYKIEDTNGDGNYSPLDRQILGYRDPAYRFSIANKLNYKNFSLYVFINSIQGGKDYYYADGSPYADGAHYKQDQLSYSNVPGWDYWMPENPNAKYRRLDIPSNFEPRPYDQRNFIRLQDVSLSYNFEPAFLDKLNINNLKVYLSGKNLLTLTKWEGWDPETGVGVVAGIPVMRSYAIGLNVEF